MSSKERQRKKRHRHIRRKVSGTGERPRLCVHRSSKNLYVQVVDDTRSHTLFSFSTMDKQFASARPATGGKMSQAEKLGEFYADKLKEKGIQKISFDRGGYAYHGRVKALADSLRQGGIQF